MVKNFQNLQTQFLIGILILIVDQTLKFISLNSNNFEINSGFTFGFFQGSNILVTLITSVILMSMLIFSLKNKFHPGYFFIIFCAGLSNIIDRILRGGVIDYIRVGDFPVFNIADVTINLMLLYLIIKIIYDEDSKAKSR